MVYYFSRQDQSIADALRISTRLPPCVPALLALYRRPRIWKLGLKKQTKITIEVQRFTNAIFAWMPEHKNYPRIKGLDLWYILRCWSRAGSLIGIGYSRRYCFKVTRQMLLTRIQLLRYPSSTYNPSARTGLRSS